MIGRMQRWARVTEEWGTRISERMRVYKGREHLVGREKRPPKLFDCFDHYTTIDLQLDHFSELHELTTAPVHNEDSPTFSASTPPVPHPNHPCSTSER